MNIPLNLAWLESTSLAAVRMTVFLFLAPPFSFNAIPARIKAMLAIGLSLAVSPAVSRNYHTLETPEYLMALVLELVVGAVLGLLVMLVFAAIQSAGSLIDLFGGFSMAQGFDPLSMINGAQFTRLFQMTALALMFSSGAYQIIIGGLTRSFTAFPIGGGIDLSEPVQAMTTGLTQMFLASVQIAGPLLVVLFLADAGLGLLTRVAPALNAFTMSFPLKIMMTLTLVSVIFVALPGVVSKLTGDAIKVLAGVG
ncbi:flagellar biosynthetic protein FliR [Parafrigoribacterium soli]|uniref:flagellar biosynthetic protein FliR n=1 Tax=Parafrigoribacterium soli TaxID=3144663 RepID=UPI0032EAF388